ncbi:MAG: CerR family C-terminal domain-containing protein [Myxococcota bacterium]
MKSDDAQLKQRLLDAALHLFAEHGRDGVSVRDIAEKARATHGSIRHHFGTKDNLYLAAIMQLKSIDSFLPNLDPLQELGIRHVSNEEQLRHMVRHFVTFQAKASQDRIASLGMIRAEVTREGGPDPVFYDRVIRPAHDRMKQILQSIRPDITDDETLEIIAFNIIFQCVMIRIGNRIVLKRLGKRKLTRRDTDRIAELIADTALEGLKNLDG